MRVCLPCNRRKMILPLYSFLPFSFSPSFFLFYSGRSFLPSSFHCFVKIQIEFPSVVLDDFGSLHGPPLLETTSATLASRAATSPTTFGADILMCFGSSKLSQIWLPCLPPSPPPRLAFAATMLSSQRARATAIDLYCSVVAFAVQGR